MYWVSTSFPVPIPIDCKIWLDRNKIDPLCTELELSSCLRYGARQMSAPYHSYEFLTDVLKLLVSVLVTVFEYEKPAVLLRYRYR